MAKVTIQIDGKELSQEDKNDLYISISCRLGFIETGNCSLRAEDAIDQKKHSLIKPLSAEQRKLVVRLEEIMYGLML